MTGSHLRPMESEFLGDHEGRKAVGGLSLAKVAQGRKGLRGWVWPGTPLPWGLISFLPVLS